jgi:hypothetical protein
MERDVDLDARLRAALAASRELGPEYDSAMVDSIRRLVVEQQIDHAVAPVEMRPKPASPVSVVQKPRRFARHGFAGASLVLAVPLTAVAGSYGHLAGVAVCWLGVVLVNVVDRLSPRHDDADR